MPAIVLTTEIKAPLDVCFDLARSINLHTESMNFTEETATGGTTTGLISLGESVTWRAKHFGLWLSLTSEINAFDSPKYFRDSMVRGPFSRFDHDHHFEEIGIGITQMRDIFDYTSPLGIFGGIADALFLKRYMTELLRRRNAHIKSVAENGT